MSVVSEILPGNKVMDGCEPVDDAKTDEIVDAPHLLAFNPNQRTITWERLEFLRLKKLHLGSNRYSRHFQRFQRENSQLRHSFPAGDLAGYTIGPKGEIKKNNSIAPFSTVGKPTCGFFFSRETDNKKQKIGIPPTNLVKWRSFVQ